jgi:hypothetical protein
MVRIRGIAIAALVLCPAFGHAQAPARSADQLKLVVDEGQQVTVTDRSGRETSGRLIRLAEDGVSLQVRDATLDWQLADIQRIQKREVDSLTNGVLIGAVIGAGTAGGLLVYPCTHVAECGGEVAAFVALWGSVGAGLGALVDSMRAGNRTVYEALPQRTSISVAPAVTPNTKALAVRLTF